MEFNVQKAIYLQIVDYICENILIGKWKEGDRIPSVREMAVDIEVNPNTILRTYSFLQDRGVIFNQRGIGYFISDKGVENAKNLKKDDFLSHEVPYFIKTMELLNLSYDELVDLYKQKKKWIIIKNNEVANENVQ